MRRSNSLYNTYAAFKNYSREEVTKMTNLEPFLILFPVEYLKEILTPETNKLLKYPMEPGEIIWWFGCWFCMGFWVIIYNGRNWCSTAKTTMSEGAIFIINKYMSRTKFEGILFSLRYMDRKDVEYNYRFLPHASNVRSMEHEHGRRI